MESNNITRNVSFFCYGTDCKGILNKHYPCYYIHLNAELYSSVKNKRNGYEEQSHVEDSIKIKKTKST